MTRWILGAALLLATTGLAMPAARAQAPGPGSAEAATLASECARLRESLERTNSEISALKRSDRGVGDDYRLRRKMADAEALARRLTEAEARLRQLRGPAPSPAPAADPGDAPAVLEARADILSDEARRLTAEAAVLGRAADQLRSRQTLRRRAGQLEQDPFASVESPKRQLFVGARSLRANAGGGATDTKGNAEGPARGADPSAPGDSGSKAPGMAGAPVSTPTTPSAPSLKPPSDPQPTPQPVLPPPQPSQESTGAPPPSAPPAGIVSRALIDPAAIAEIRRVEAGGRPLTEVEKMERAASALRARVQALQAEAAALRARASRR
jgi:hypothetical protein